VTGHARLGFPDWRFAFATFASAEDGFRSRD
jgi:hypothetical protein